MLSPRPCGRCSFWFRDVPGKRSRYRLKLERPEVEVCLTDPGLGVALTVETTLRTMVDVWMGDRDVSAAIRTGSIELKGEPAAANPPRRRHSPPVTART